jgi:hypothetical protein
MRIDEILGPLIKTASPVIKTAANSVRTLGQMSAMILRLGLPVAVAADISKEVYVYATTEYPDEARKERAYNLMLTKISVILAGAFAGMGVASMATFYGTLGLSTMSKTLRELSVIAGGTIGAEFAAHSEIVQKTVKVLVYTLHPEATYLDAKEEATSWLEKKSEQIKASWWLFFKKRD